MKYRILEHTNKNGGVYYAIQNSNSDPEKRKNLLLYECDIDQALDKPYIHILLMNSSKKLVTLPSIPDCEKVIKWLKEREENSRGKVIKVI